MALFDPSTVTNLMGPVQAGQQYAAMQGQQIANTRNAATLPYDIAASQADTQMKQQQVQQNAALFPNAQQMSNLNLQGAQLSLASQRINGALGLLYMANDPNSWEAMRNKASQMGFDPSIIPEKFDPAWKQQAIMGMMPMKDRIDMQLKMREQNLGAVGKAAEMSGQPNLPIEAAQNGMVGMPPSMAPGADGMPSAAGGLRAPEQVEGAKQDIKNAVDYKKDLIGRVQEGEGSIRIINAQEALLNKFKSGAWTTDRANAANMLQSIGAPQKLVDMVSTGDPAAVQAFEGLASQHAMLQLKSLMANGRVGQREFLSFKEDLANPDKLEPAIRAINNIQRQSYGAAADELAAMSKWEQQGKPLNLFRESYSKQMQQQLGQAPPSNAPMKKTLGGVNYVKINGKWYAEGK